MSPTLLPSSLVFSAHLLRLSLVWCSLRFHHSEPFFSSFLQCDFVSAYLVWFQFEFFSVPHPCITLLILDLVDFANDFGICVFFLFIHWIFDLNFIFAFAYFRIGYYHLYFAHDAFPLSAIGGINKFRASAKARIKNRKMSI